MLTRQEIKHIVSSITENPHFTDYYTSQLRDVVVNPKVIPKLIRTLVKKHQECLVQPGENVDIICAQSIGEKFTQSFLNTFHKAGLPTPKGITSVEELLNVSKNPKSKFCTIIPKTSQDSHIYERLLCITTRHITVSMSEHVMTNEP